MTLPDELNTIAGALPADWDTRRAAAAAVLVAAMGNDPECSQDLADATILKALYDAASVAADSHSDMNVAAMPGIQGYINAVDGQITTLNAQYAALVAGGGTGIQTLIDDGRTELTTHFHHAASNALDWLGSTECSTAMRNEMLACPNGTSGQRRTYDLWPGATYLVENKIRFNLKNYVHIEGHGDSNRAGLDTYGAGGGGATLKSYPTIALGSCVFSTASRIVTGTGFPTATSGPNSIVGRELMVPPFQAWVRTPDTYVEAVLSSTSFRLNRVPLQSGTRTAWAVSGGIPTGAGFPRTPEARDRIHLSLESTIGCKVLGLTIDGALPANFNVTNQYGATVPRNDNTVEAQHAIQFAGGTNPEVAFCTLLNVHGDGAYISENANVNSNGVIFRNNLVRRVGRQGTTPVQTDNCKIIHNDIGLCGRSWCDIELYQKTWRSSNIEVGWNRVGHANANFIGSVCDGHVDVVKIHDNDIIGWPLTALVQARTYWSEGTGGHLAAGATPADQWHDWEFSRNVGQLTVGNGAGAAMSFSGIDGFELIDNFQVMKLSSATTPKPFMVFAECRGFGPAVGGGSDPHTTIINTTVSGNDSNLTALAEARVNKILMPSSTVSEKAGLPVAACCLVGAVASGQTGTPSPHTTPNGVAGITALETSLGRTVDVHRIFCSPSDGYDVNKRDAELRNDQANGRVSILSMKIPAGQTWFGMSSSPLLDTAVARLKFYTETVGCKIVFLVEHEIDRPDPGESPADPTIGIQRGTPADYSALVGAQFAKIKAPGGAPKVTTCVQTSYYRLYRNSVAPSDPAGITPAGVKAYFPVNMTLMDCYGTDVYNDPIDDTRRSIPFSELVQPHYDLALSIGKPLVLHEVGCARIADVCSTNGQPAPNPNRNTWVQGVYDYIKTHTQIKHLSWYHSNNNAIGITCFPPSCGAAGTDALHDWWMDDTPALKTVHVNNAVSVTGPYGNYFNPYNVGALITGNPRAGVGSSSPAIWSNDTHQFCIVVQRKTIPVGAWDAYIYKRAIGSASWGTGYNLKNAVSNALKLPVGNLDNHRVVVGYCDGANRIHVAGNTHTSPMPRQYIRSVNPNDITSWTTETVPDTAAAASGSGGYTYNHFCSLADGTLLWFYDQQESATSAIGRDILLFTRGPSDTSWSPWAGNGEFVISRHGVGGNPDPVPTDPDRVYVGIPWVDDSDVIHVHGIWRDVDNDADTQTDPWYLKSTNGGVTWRNAAGTVVTMPLTFAGRAIATVDNGGEISHGGGGTCVDAAGHVHFLIDGGTTAGGDKGLQHYWWTGTIWKHELMTKALPGDPTKQAVPGNPVGRVYYGALGNGYPNMMFFQGDVWVVGEVQNRIWATNLETGTQIRLAGGVPRDLVGVPPPLGYGADLWFPHVDRNRLKSGFYQTMVPNGDTPVTYSSPVE